LVLYLDFSDVLRTWFAIRKQLMTIVVIFRFVKICKTMPEENPAPIRRQTRKCSEKDTCRTIIEGKF
jgi:hypothetical protein